MATEETVQTTEAVTKKPLYLLPKFTDSRWKDGMYDAEHKIVVPSMNIREDELLTFDQRVEVETRSLIFQYQLKYAEKEYELLRKEFQSIEERLNQREAADVKPVEFVKPVDPVKKPAKKKPGKNRTTSTSGSGSDTKDSADDGKSSKERSGKPTKSKSGSDTDKELTSPQEAVRRSGRFANK
ncbi:hypothetical protein AVEN_203034-1 [Araneus ventricosus]|uniref:Uncharacterized protein n=1 Tax=Araneus ventricosus TaxID=182803 RepID=A0A4Y2WED3_ARAVE|nr:hypothetical protein AVEN_137677-1 [Araneus ventricosus]GBO36048.1 hypothetical protein AVEN_203034-1 [Araneus ventricosus]